MIIIKDWDMAENMFTIKDVDMFCSTFLAAMSSSRSDNVTQSLNPLVLQSLSPE